MERDVVIEWAARVAVMLVAAAVIMLGLDLLHRDVPAVPNIGFWAAVGVVWICNGLALVAGLYPDRK